MIKGKKVLAAILARGGSKGLPKKNIRLLGGKPLIVYSIELAKACPSIDKIVFSTDSEEIAAVACEAGIAVPFLRPSELAGDLTPEAPVIEHCLAWLKEYESYEPDLIVLLRPTGPLRTAHEVEETIRILESHPEADSIRSMEEPPKSPYKMWKPVGDYIKPFVENFDGPKDFHTGARQLLPKVFQSTPDIHIFTAATLKNKKSIIGDIVLPYYLTRRTVDIDDEFDFEIAEHLIKKREKG